MSYMVDKVVNIGFLFNYIVLAGLPSSEPTRRVQSEEIDRRSPHSRCFVYQFLS